jgi:hypothetical protein
MTLRPPDPKSIQRLGAIWHYVAFQRFPGLVRGVCRHHEASDLLPICYQAPDPRLQGKRTRCLG